MTTCTKEETASSYIDENGDIVLPPNPPPRTGWNEFFVRLWFFYFFIPVVFPGFVLKFIYKDKHKWSDVSEIVSAVFAGEKGKYTTSEKYQSVKLHRKVWKLQSASHYIGQLEWQAREGFCGPATLRCVLKSYSNFPSRWLPEAKSGGMSISQWHDKLNEITRDSKGEVKPFKTKVILGDEGFDAFMEGIRKVNDPNCRVAINFLRGALSGFGVKPWWVPSHLILSMFGHFSPIIGVLEKEDGFDEPLVAVFDVNHKHGMYLAPARVLYESVRVKDMTVGTSRGIIVVEHE